MNMNNYPPIHALWIGDTLGKISQCCLTSFIRRGHSVYLHTYGNITDLPDGVIISDANKIIPKEHIFKHKKTGSYAVFADIFRYKLLKYIDGIYVDCDVYCLKPLSIPKHGYLFGFEEDDRINNAILSLPQKSQLLKHLIETITHKGFVPEWYSTKAKNRLIWRSRIGLPKHISEMPWGVTGPDALSYFAKDCQVNNLAQDIDIFYPIHYNRISQLLTPHLTIDDITTHRTLCIHLYNEKLRSVNIDTLNKNSLLAKMLNNEI